MIDSTGFRSGGNENAASMIQRVGVDCSTCRTEERALPETAKCVSAKPRIWSALWAGIKALAGLLRRQNAQKGSQQGRSR